MAVSVLRVLSMILLYSCPVLLDLVSLKPEGSIWDPCISPPPTPLPAIFMIDMVSFHSDITEEDLEEAGVNDPAHKKIILENLKLQK